LLVTFPWESRTAYLWTNPQPITFLNHLTLQRILLQYPTFRESIHYSEKHQQEVIAIHFRCSDNIANGLFSMNAYKEILKEIHTIHTMNITATTIVSSNAPKTTSTTSLQHRRIIIYTDVEYGKTHEYELCWSLLGALQQAILTTPHYTMVEINIVHNSAIASYLGLHFAGVTICGLSTFCIMSSYGASLVYVPLGSLLLSYPGNYTANIRTYRSTIYRYKGEVNPANVLKDLQG
jgi:hypothetical protein